MSPHYLQSEVLSYPSVAPQHSEYTACFLTLAIPELWLLGHNSVTLSHLSSLSSLFSSFSAPISKSLNLTPVQPASLSKCLERKILSYIPTLNLSHIPRWSNSGACVLIALPSNSNACSIWGPLLGTLHSWPSHPFPLSSGVLRSKFRKSAWAVTMSLC